MVKKINYTVYGFFLNELGYAGELPIISKRRWKSRLSGTKTDKNPASSNSDNHTTQHSKHQAATPTLSYLKLHSFTACVIGWWHGEAVSSDEHQIFSGVREKAGVLEEAGDMRQFFTR